ncbi:MAG TPA: hypothetical protein PKV98_04465 [Burkholderiaceae bacterium]|nr:hypothetical protein [Burkholderiaceae bacterium]
MMSPQTIRSMSRKAARDSLARGDVPLLVTERDLGVLDEHLRHMPFLGDRCPRGWKRVPACSLVEDTHGLVPFGGAEQNHYVEVDSSGFGGEGEIALTFSQFCQWVSERGAGYGYAIVEAGQFQVVVGIFKERA